MNEFEIYTAGQEILKIISFPEYEGANEYNIFFRGIFDKYGTIYGKTIFETNLIIELCLNNTDVVSQLVQKLDELLNIKWEILIENTLVLKNNDAKKFLDNIYIGSDARYRNEKNYECYLRWLKIQINDILTFNTKKTLDNAILPLKNNIGYDISIVKENKKIGKNTIVYDTGIKIDIDFGYRIKITAKCCLVNYGFILNNYSVKKDESIKIILTRIDNLKIFTLPFTGFNLTIEKIDFFELEIS